MSREPFTPHDASSARRRRNVAGRILKHIVHGRGKRAYRGDRSQGQQCQQHRLSDSEPVPAVSGYAASGFGSESANVYLFHDCASAISAGCFRGEA